jgi:hypothetical protein
MPYSNQFGSRVDLLWCVQWVRAARRELARGNCGRWLASRAGRLAVDSCARRGVSGLRRRDEHMANASCCAQHFVINVKSKEWIP